MCLGDFDVGVRTTRGKFGAVRSRVYFHPTTAFDLSHGSKEGEKGNETKLNKTKQNQKMGGMQQSYSTLLYCATLVSGLRGGGEKAADGGCVCIVPTNVIVKALRVTSV